MPELPEVETTLRGIEPHISGEIISSIIIRNKNLRWPVPATIKKHLPGQKLNQIQRRGKYLLLFTDKGTAILHLGMSGSLRICDTDTAAEKHDHVDIIFKNGKVLRFRDPRRFGCLLWTNKPVEQHKLISPMGPEPLTDEFNGDYLFEKSRKRKSNIKGFIMDSKVVTGVGNIYASEALFAAGILPSRQAGRVSKERYQVLASCIKDVLIRAIKQGGTTLKDFTREDGQPGYFKQSLKVYDRAGQSCITCKQIIKQKTLGQRSTYYCSHCQR
ncbi:MAG: bifunctional DNA-formamidopyrimidine glycosylase/DNA-(apurinic or apyrimidinic site) lyase [Gammaproteobacteria bacterium]|nr:bifunctional DNA-formamidopyrimidine glycosylase/DNA-(apurinic or apyrimidinic site) lyase [Gammaproteobacteria bacterium]